jgi:ribonuclease Z
MLQMTLLGVGTAVPDPDRENTHMVWEAPDGLLLIDAGGSTYQRLLRANLDPLKLRAIFLTHAHPDHINGLPVLLFQLSLAGFQHALPVYGNSPTLQRVQQVVEAFDLGSHQIHVDWTEVQPNDEVPLQSQHYRLMTAPTAHPAPCMALRFEDRASGRALVYSADTEPCDAVQSLAHGAAVLIHEATTPEPFPGHTTPFQAGQVAAAAGVEHLVLVHFSPRWTMSAAQAVDSVREGGFGGDVDIGREFGKYAL